MHAAAVARPSPPLARLVLLWTPSDCDDTPLVSLARKRHSIPQSIDYLCRYRISADWIRRDLGVQSGCPRKADWRIVQQDSWFSLSLGPLKQSIWPITYRMARALTIRNAYFARFDIPLTMALLSALIMDTVRLPNAKRVPSQLDNCGTHHL